MGLCRREGAPLPGELKNLFVVLSGGTQNAAVSFSVPSSWTRLWSSSMVVRHEHSPELPPEAPVRGERVLLSTEKMGLWDSLHVCHTKPTCGLDFMHARLFCVGVCFQLGKAAIASFRKRYSGCISAGKRMGFSDKARTFFS